MVMTRTPHVRGTLLRILSAVLAVWLVVMPQIMFSRSMVSFYNDIGATPSPITEEEEVKHSCAPLALPCAPAPMVADDDARDMPSLDERIEVATHGDVASPPPKVIVG